MYSIGIDLGTSSNKGILIDEQGKILAEAHIEYALDTQGEDLCELDPEIYWTNVQTIIHNLLAESKVDPLQIKGIACASQAETLICIDNQGIPLRKAFVWLDNRSTVEAKEIQEYFGKEKVFQFTGQPEVVATWPATKIAWMRKNEPKIFSKVHKFLMVEDYIMYKLSGKFVTEPSISSSTIYLDINKKIWWDEMLDYLQITKDQLPEIIKSGTSIGKIQNPTLNNLSRLGRIQNCLVITGAYDHAAGAIGAGNIETGMISETTGSSMAMVVTMDKALLDIRMSVPCQVHCLEGKYFLLPYGQTAGMALKWFANQFGNEELAQSAKENKDIYDLLTDQAAQVPIGSEGLTMLPHLAGAGSPEFDSDCRGVFAGISLSMSKGHFVRALMESVVSMVNKNIEAIKSSGFKPLEIRALGGGAKSSLWNQMKADMTGLTIKTLDVREAPSLGAAILAGVGSGVFESIEEGCKKVVQIRDIYTPQKTNFSAYQIVYKKYCSLYDSLVGFWKD